MLVIELVFKWKICQVLWSLVVFDLVDNLAQNNVAWFLMGDFLQFNFFEREKNCIAALCIFP